MSARIDPVSPPYSQELKIALEKWMPPNSGLEPLKLFRTLAHHSLLSDRMRGLGSVFLGRGTLGLRVRELLILRTCARCHAEYEWGVHVAAFATSAEIDEALVRATRLEPPTSFVHRDDLDASVLRAADELHDTGTLSDATWSSLTQHFQSNQILELIALVGFYHLISFVTNAARVEHEPWAAAFPT